MGLFDDALGRFNRPRPAPDAAPAAPAATNAPRAWPRPAFDGAGGSTALMEIKLAAEMQRAGAPRLVRLASRRLTPQGVLYAPIEVETPEGRRLVKVYPDASPASAADFAGFAAALERRGELPPVWYAPAPLPSAPPSDPHEPFGAHVVSLAKDRAAEEMAAWWQQEDDPDFLASPTFRAMDRAGTALDGIHTHVFAAWLRAVDEAYADVGRAKLPPDLTLPLTGPDDARLQLAVSAEKGLRFQFPRSTPRAYRETFWTLFAEYAEGWKGEALRQGIPLDEPGDASPLRWWTGAKRVLEGQRARGEQTTAFAVSMPLPR